MISTADFVLAALPCPVRAPAGRAVLAPRTRPSGSILAVLAAIGLIEPVLPWTVIWLSNKFFFDVPFWSIWPLLAILPALGLLVILSLLLRAAPERWLPGPKTARRSRD